MQLNPIERTYRRLCAAGNAPLKLFEANPTRCGFIFPNELLQEAYGRALAHVAYEPAPKGLLCAREAIAAYYASEGWQVDPERILLTSGTSESFLQLFMMLCRPGEKILVPNPAYPLFEHIGAMAHVECVQYHLDPEQQWQPELAELEALCDERTRALLLISPHNPTGAVISAELAQRLTAWANRKGLALICDEVFANFYYGPGAYPRLAACTQPDLCFTLNGLSKLMALPQAKLAWIVVSGTATRSEAMLELLELSNDTLLTCHSAIQRALPQLLREGRDFIRSYQAGVLERRQLALRTLNEQAALLSCIAPQGGFYMLAEVKAPLPWNEEDFVIKLMEATGIFVHPGFFYDYDVNVHCVLSYLHQEEVFRSAVHKIFAFIQAECG